MKNEKNIKVECVVGLLKERNHLVEVKQNGHLRVSGCDFWATTEKYYNPQTGEKGKGFRNFLNMIEKTT